MLKYSILLLLLFAACIRSRKVETPKEFVNDVKVDPSLYSKDSISILENLYGKMRKHESSFQSPEYFDSTTLYLDTILYDSTRNKIALFVIAENPVRRNPHSDSKLPYYYNANCYLGKREYPNSSYFALKNIGPVSIINFDDKATANKAIRESYFSELTTFLDAEAKPHYDFNVNDKRFWTSAKGWSRAFP
jgi:hypothetical protein